MEKRRTEFLYLNEAEMIEAGVLDYARCIEVEEEVFQQPDELPEWEEEGEN